jgi:peptidoglycan/xylan/chitin deacetylase (PgdA/CDA1 family)
MAILMYHHVAECPLEVDPSHRGLWVPPAEFSQQVQLLAKWGYVGVTLDAVADALQGKASLPSRWVCFTFDDARVDNLTVAEPLLAVQGFPMTVFAVSSWTKGLTNPDDSIPQGVEATLGVAGLMELQRRGHCIGAHTVTHPRLTRLADEAVHRELLDCRKVLGSVLGKPPEWLAYPYGNVAPRIMAIARESGYRGAVTTIRDNRVKGRDLHALPRVMIQPGITPLRFRYMLSWWYSLLHRWKNLNRWKGMANR